MKTLVEKLELKGNPFEHYTAETEPNIADYAVRPPYLQAISERVRGLSSFILFGDRGAGKSATRITVFGEVWKQISQAHSEQKSPFVLNMTDYSALQESFRKDRLTERDIVGMVAFYVVEQILVWLASLEEEERVIFVDGLNASERTLILALLKGFYVSVPELDRDVSTREALRLLNSTWVTRSRIWASRQWNSLSTIIASTLSALSRKELGENMDISVPAEALLRSLVGDSPNVTQAILTRIVDFVQAFGFSGVSILVDKVDETPTTSNSAESTARLIYPLLAHVQLLEIRGVSWVFFLWSEVKNHLNGKYAVRLDKIAHSSITWNSESLRAMVEARVQFFSGNRLHLKDLFDSSIDVDDTFRILLDITMNSPRELIKLLDTILREHDARGDQAPDLIDIDTLAISQDKFSVDTVGDWFASGPLQQVLRLGRISFVNRDVQAAFKIGDQGARNRIKNWEDAGLVKQSGTVPNEIGAKQAYRFVVTDTRVKRVIERKLLDVVGAEGDQPEEGDSTESKSLL